MSLTTAHKLMLQLMPKIQQLYHMRFFLLTKYSMELYFNFDSICHFNFSSELEHKKIIACPNGLIKRDHFFLPINFY